MYSFAASWCIVKDFVGYHPRGWSIFREVFYCRWQTLVEIFAENQFLWNHIKALVKKFDKYGVKYDVETVRLNLPSLIALNPHCRVVWNQLKTYDQYSDAMDVFLYKRVVVYQQNKQKSINNA